MSSLQSFRECKRAQKKNRFFKHWADLFGHEIEDILGYEPEGVTFCWHPMVSFKGVTVSESTWRNGALVGEPRFIPNDKLDEPMCHSEFFDSSTPFLWLASHTLVAYSIKNAWALYHVNTFDDDGYTVRYEAAFTMDLTTTPQGVVMTHSMCSEDRAESVRERRPIDLSTITYSECHVNCVLA